jgi:adenosylhomocysteine nucleosidase
LHSSSDQLFSFVFFCQEYKVREDEVRILETISFIAALKQEIRPFLRRVGARRKGAAEGFTTWRFDLFGRECLLILSGVGLMRATRAVHALFSATRPRLVVSFGIAGAPQNDLCVGDVIAAHTVRSLSRGSPGRSQDLLLLSEPAREAAARALRPLGARFLPGTALTTPGVQPVDLAGLFLEHPVLEMETAGIAQACSRRGVPVLALRGVSDSVDQPLPFDLEACLDSDQNLRVARLLAGLVRDPSLFARLNRLRRNAARAAENCTVAMLAALEKHLSP